MKNFLGVGYVLTKRNHSELDYLVSGLNDMGVDYIYFRPVEEDASIIPDNNELYRLKAHLAELTEHKRIKCMLTIQDRLIEQNDGLPCVAHSLTSIIHADGEVVLCEKRRHDILKLGNVNSQSFEEIWNSKLRKDITARLLDPDCQKGCAACRITSFNKIFYNLLKANTRNFI